MNLIFDESTVEELQKKGQIVIHLDRFTKDGNTLNAYLPLSVDNLNIEYLNKFGEFAAIHEQFREALVQKSWQAAAALAGVLQEMSGSELATYYSHYQEKIPELATLDLPENWDGTIFA